MTIALLFALALPKDPATTPEWIQDYQAGYSYHYHMGGFAQVARNRHMNLDWSADGFASTPRCDKIGWYVRAKIAGRVLRLQQIDCSSPRDLPAQRRKGLVVEINAKLAQMLGFYAYDGWGGSGRAPAVILGWQR